MRRIIEFLALRALRTRLGIAIAIALVVLGIVGMARLLAGPDHQRPGLTGDRASPIATVDPTSGDDGVRSIPPSPSPRTSPGASAPDAVARAFAIAWLDHRGVSAEQWHTGLAPHATPELWEKLAGVDPVVVPADRLTGEPVVIVQTEELVEVTMPLDAGRLRLELVAPAGRWLVDTVDWERS